MSITPRVSAALLAVALALPLAACTTTPSPTPSATATTPTPTPTTLSSADQDLEAAKQAIIDLWTVVDRLTNDPQASLQDLDTVASGPTLDFFRKDLTGYRLEQLTGSGESIIEIQSAEASGNNSDGLATSTVSSCVDTSQTTLVDPQGESVTSPPYRFLHRSVVVQKAGSLVVVDQDEVMGTC